jgi:serine/threonine-protein kinase RsbW
MSISDPRAGIQWLSPPRAADMTSSRRYSAALTVPNRIESVRPATAFLVQVARALQVPRASEHMFEVAITEALANAVKHGKSETDDATIQCEIEVQDRQLTLRILDCGRGFRIPDPRLPDINPDRVESLPEAGYGLPIIQSVFPVVRAIDVNNKFGVELRLTY